MKIIDCVQGTPEWLSLRTGIITASRLDRLVTPRKGELSKSATALRNDLLAERLIGMPLDAGDNQWMARGKAMEAEARAWYEFEFDVSVIQAGFCLSDDGRFGCSPDGLVGGDDDGGLEIKCPGAGQHVGYLLSRNMDDYRCQVQGALLLTGRRWWDIVSFSPCIPPVVIRCQRDQAFIDKLASAIEAFNVDLEACWDRLASLKADTVAAKNAASQNRFDDWVNDRGPLAAVDQT